MKRLFSPKSYIKNYQQIDLEALKKKGIKLLICDLDNTLVAHDVTHPDEKVEHFIRSVQKTGLEICIISNNHRERVEVFAQALGIHFYSFAKKPLKQTYKKIMQDYHLSAQEIASVGDQLLTDVIGGNRMRIYTILTHPLVERDLGATKINRRIEQYVYRYLERKKLLKRGVFDE